MKSDKRSELIIIVCANGYEVLPSDQRNACGYTSQSRFVFSTFESLTLWLQDNLKQPEEA